MNFELYRILVDGGLVVLIWIVQLVVYPSFSYYNEQEVKRWHPSYTFRISLIVLPLMVGQVVLYARYAYLDPGNVSIGMLLLVIALWLITFLKVVPLHHAIDSHPDSGIPRKQLVQINWYRTAGWTILFLINLLTYAK